MTIDNFFKPLSKEPDEFDYKLHQEICNTDVMTRRLRELVPLLDVIDFSANIITEDETVLSCPLLEKAMNQNGTHQASVFYLMADYTTGVGMMGAIPGIYVSAIHERCKGQPIQYWLKKSTVEHLKPGTGPMTSRIVISKEDRARMRQEIIQKGHTEYTGRVEFYQNEQLVALSYPTMGMYADNPREYDKRPSVFQVQNAQLMSLLDQGLHCEESENVIAQDQGKGMAERFVAVVPEIATLVSTRAQALKDWIERKSSDFEQVVMLGIGMSQTPSVTNCDNVNWYGLDLKAILQDRREREQKEGLHSNAVELIPADIRRRNIMDSLLKSSFEPIKKTLFVLEGVSMFLSKQNLEMLLKELAEFNHQKQYQVWLDHYSGDFFASEQSTIKTFRTDVTRLGDPLLTGFNTIEEVSSAWTVDTTARASSFVSSENALYDEYCFSTLIAQ